jgi:2-oxo-4-hydroxy-4-carboxy-5-ureidoimidazoline decarboxylase
LIEPQERLFSCFASRRWAQRVAEMWPYPDLDSLLAAAERAWSELGPSDWAEAMAGHPRIGEHGGSSPAASEREQSGVRVAAAGTLEHLAAENRLYEGRFGHVFLIAAAGKSADEILAALRKRMENDAVTEDRIASAELRKIARLRLEEVIPSPRGKEGRERAG